MKILHFNLLLVSALLMCNITHSSSILEEIHNKHTIKKAYTLDITGKEFNESHWNDVKFNLLVSGSSSKKNISMKKGQDSPMGDILEIIVNKNSYFKKSNSTKKILLSDSPFGIYHYNYVLKTNPIPFIYPLVLFEKNILPEMTVFENDTNIFIKWHNTRKTIDDGDILEFETILDKQHNYIALKTYILFKNPGAANASFYYFAGKEFDDTNNRYYPKELKIGNWAKSIHHTQEELNNISIINNPNDLKLNENTFQLLGRDAYSDLDAIKSIKSIPGPTLMVEYKINTFEEIALEEDSIFWPDVKEGYRYEDHREKYKDISDEIHTIEDNNVKRLISGKGPHQFSK